MGLDIYLHHISKPNISSDTILTPSFCSEKNFIYFSKEQFVELPSTMQNMCIVSKLKEEYLNLPKILRDNGFKASAPIQQVSWSNLSSTFEVTDKFKKSEIVISNKELEEKYTFEQINKVYVLCVEEIDYQRKGLNDRGWDLLPGNCEYCDNKALIQQICEEGGLSESFIENWIDGETVFYAWW